MNRFIRFLFSVIVLGCFLPGIYAQQGKKDTISILSFNDFHGAFIPGQGTPGADNFVSALLDLKGKVPHPVILSGGDNFSGSYFSLMSGGEPHLVFTLPAASDTLISAIGNHELDWGDSYLLGTSCLYINYVGANVAGGGDKQKAFKEKVPGYRIVERGDKRIGIIGLSTPTTPSSGKKPYVDDYTFDGEFTSTVNSLAEKLRKEKQADMVVLLMHIGTDMAHGVPVIHPTDSASEKNLRKLSGIDAIVSGHSHKLVHGMFTIEGSKQVPMIQAGRNGSHIGLMQFEITDEGVRFIRDSLVQVSVPHPVIRQAVDSISRKEGFNEVYVEVTKELVHDRNRNLHKFTEVGALVTASYKARFYSWIKERMQRSTRSALPSVPEQPVLAVHHFNGIRAGLPQGEVTRAQVGNVLPFGGILAAYCMNGKQVRKLFTAGLHPTLPRGFLQTCDMMFEMTNGKITCMKWRNRQGKYVEIKDDTQCVILCDDFIADGGDDYPKELFNNNEISEFKDEETTRCFVEYMRGAKKVPNESYKIAIVNSKDSGKVELGGKVEDWNNGGSISGEATME